MKDLVYESQIDFELLFWLQVVSNQGTGAMTSRMQRTYAPYRLSWALR